MTRAMDAAQVTGLQQEIVPLLPLVRADFPTTPMYVHGGVGVFSFGGNDYVGVGNEHGLIDIVEETIDSRPPDVRLAFRNVPTTMVDPAIFEKYHGRDIYVYFSVCNEYGVPVATPFEIFRGTMDYIDVEVGDTTTSYLLECKNIMHNWNRAKIKRVTDAELQRRFPGDTAFKYLAQMATRVVTWGGGGTVGTGQDGNDPINGDVTFTPP